MLDHLKEEGQAQTTATAADSAEGDSKWPSFEGWGSIIGEKAELIAGHHRVEAFKEYLWLCELPEEEQWWVCSIYDKGFSPARTRQASKLTKTTDTLPPHLHIQLWANWEEITLPDNRGQIWTKLATISCKDNQLFQGSNRSVE
jgi:hypothetical protein